MDLPDPISAIGEQLSGGGPVTPPEEFFEAYEVFGTELSNIFIKPWLAVDHASRLGEDNSYFRLDVGSRSVVLVRETAQCMHALRNVCLHAGYRICDEEDGKGNHLFCYYHGWDYALDGRLTEPELRPEIEDRSRFRLPRYAMQIRRGVIFVDLSVAGPNPPEPGPIELGAVPEDLGERVVTRRQRYPTTWNWKHLRDFLWQRKELVFPDGDCDTATEFGALSFIATRGDETVLARLVPRFPGHTDVDLVRLAPPGAAPAAGEEDRVAAAVRDPAGELSPGFYHWYWSALSASAKS